MQSTQFIARRYLFSRSHISLISTLTTISIVGVSIGTALLIIVLSVFNGFFDVIKGFLQASDPDIRIESSLSSTFLPSDSLIQVLRSESLIEEFSPYVEGKALLVFKDRSNQVIPVKGIDMSSFFLLQTVEGSMIRGVFDVDVRDRTPGLIVHSGMSSLLNLYVEDEVALLSAAGMRRALTQITVPRSTRFEVRGIYNLEQISNGPQAFIDLEAARRLFKLRNEVSGYDIRLTNQAQAEEVKAVLNSKLDDRYTISTWYDLQKPLYDVMNLEKWGAYVVLSIIVLVAVLNILGSLTMIVIQKQRDIGILRAMGHSPSAIKSIFRQQGFYIGLIGCGAGGIIGITITWLQHTFGLVKMSSAFIIDAYPAHLQLWDVVLILSVSMMLCILASWYPANRAASIEPADAVRHE
ncbi:MAG: FtsX-like permease family protein [Bacteroidota bacterium]